MATISTITRLGDVIVPAVFTEYFIKRTMEKSTLLQSGILANTAQFDELARGPSEVITMPYWDDLIGESETISDKSFFTPERITSSDDVAVKHGRGKAWGANGLSAQMSGADPIGAIGELAAEYWDREFQKVLLATLDGVFASDSMSDKVHDISGKPTKDALISGNSFIDAIQVMGDAKEDLSGVMIHSAVEAYLAKRQLIEYVQESAQSPRVPRFMNKRVIVNDSVPFDHTTSTGTAYLFGNGAIALGNGSHKRIIETEIEREKLSLSGEDVLVTRRIFIMHPRGIKWTDAQKADTFPDIEELRIGENWQRVYEPKAIRIVKFKFKIEGDAVTKKTDGGTVTNK